MRCREWEGIAMFILGQDVLVDANLFVKFEIRSRGEFPGYDVVGTDAHGGRCVLRRCVSRRQGNELLSALLGAIVDNRDLQKPGRAAWREMNSGT
jgi:hypothetical protein